MYLQFADSLQNTATSNKHTVWKVQDMFDDDMKAAVKLSWMDYQMGPPERSGGPWAKASVWSD